jgi:hypothetical protein
MAPAPMPPVAGYRPACPTGADGFTLPVGVVHVAVRHRLDACGLGIIDDKIRGAPEMSIDLRVHAFILFRGIQMFIRLSSFLTGFIDTWHSMPNFSSSEQASGRSDKRALPLPCLKPIPAVNPVGMAVVQPVDQHMIDLPCNASARPSAPGSMERSWRTSSAGPVEPVKGNRAVPRPAAHGARTAS